MSSTHTFKAAFNHTVRWYGDNTAFVQGTSDVRYTYQEANIRAREVANALQDRGVGKGDRVALLTGPTVDNAITYFGLQKLGAIPANVHVREGPNIIQSMIEDVRPAVMMFDPAFSDLVQGLRDDLAVEEYVVFDRYGDVPEFSTALSDLLADATTAEPDAVVEPDDIAFINFSSGTTGQPKGVPHTHRDAVESAHLCEHEFRATDQDSMLNLYPPSFIAWPNLTYTMVNVGASVVFVNGWSPEDVARAIEEESISIVGLIPTQWKAMLDVIEEYDMSSVRQAMYGGETLPADLFVELQEKVTENYCTVYGSTELMMSGATLHPHQASVDTLESIGKALPNVDMRVIDPQTRDPEDELDSEEVGELIVRGPSVADEVWENPEKTEEIFHEDGWWFSGDLARIGEDGFVYIEGRTDNMIISGGANVYAERIEATVEGHPDVTESAVIGVPHEKWGEAVKAFIVTSAETVTADELDDWCRDNDNLGDFQRPKEWAIVDQLPRTNTGKLNRAELREAEGVEAHRD